ncbi:MAG: FHA domain-containing protein [Planctomycetota bacterium]
MTICWLCCDPLPPIPLGPKPLVTIGRTDKCDLVLPHKEVSRVHALIKVHQKSKVVVFEDEGSSNGSYLNGKRIPSSILRQDDVLTIGPYELVIRSNEQMLARDAKDSETTGSLELTSVARVKPTAAMTGLLQEVPMTEVLQGIEFNAKSGTLTVSAPGKREGELVFAQGQPIRARFGAHVGDEAVLEMITLTEGRFTISGDVDPGEREMSSSLTALLLEASRRIDEADLPEEGAAPDQPLHSSTDDLDAPTTAREEGPSDVATDVAEAFGDLESDEDESAA